MTAKNRHIKATRPLEPVPYGNPQYVSEQQLRDAQAQAWIGQFVALDYGGQRVAGKVVNCRAVPRMEPDEIPDFVVIVESLDTAGKNLTVRLVGQRCQFYERKEDIKL